ncbi:MAG: hypothetical protein QME94_14685, partial [Anaerolineae bacterium]|nr:hypothetical protein [Anaerolineae bacterium]
VASMLPIAIVWLFLPFVWIMLYLLVRVEGDLRQRGPRIALGVAIVLYILSKFFILPAGFMDVAPFMDRLPGAVIGTYVVALPMAILAVAGLVLWLHVRRREGAMLLTAYLVFGLADSLLTFLLYAPGMLGH